MPKWFEKGMGLIRKVNRLQVPVYAAHAGYFMVLSLFPLLVLLMGLLRWSGMAVTTLTEALEGVIPQALMPAAKNLLVNTYHSTSGMAVSLSALAALWSAGRGIYGLRRGLDAMYRVENTRGYFYTRAVSTLYTVLLLLVLLLSLVLGVFGRGLFPGALRPALLLVLQSGLFAGMYMVLPGGKNRFRDSLPGAVVASLGWLGFSRLYSVYVRYFSGYSHVYGAVYAVALSMLWLYCCISIVLYGGALNYCLQKDKK